MSFAEFLISFNSYTKVLSFELTSKFLSTVPIELMVGLTKNIGMDAVNIDEIIVWIHLKVFFEIDFLLVFNEEGVEKHFSLLTMIAIFYFEEQKPLPFCIRSIHQELISWYSCDLLEIGVIDDTRRLDF